MCKLCAPSDHFCRANLRCIDTPTFQPGERGQSGTGHGRASWLPHGGEDQEDPGGEQRYSLHTSHSSLLQSPGAALSEVFAKFDLSGDGTISIAEYRTLCQARAGYSNMRMGDIGVPL